MSVSSPEMTMIVRDMILLDQECFQPSHPLQFSDDSGWLGPPRAVPFAWEVAPGTPKQERMGTFSAAVPSDAPDSQVHATADSTAVLPAEEAANCTALVKVDSKDLAEFPESGRHSVHILESAPRSFLMARNSEVSGELMGVFKEGAVPFKWEMEPGIPRDPGQCRRILDCPLTPPPVLHSSRSMVVHSSKRNRAGYVSLLEKMRSLWIQPQRPKQDFLLRSSPARKPCPSRSSTTRKANVLLLKNSPEHSSASRSSSTKKTQSSVHSDEEDLSPVSVLDYNNSVRFIGEPVIASSRRSSASSSIHSYYHTPQDSFSWDVNVSSPASSNRGSFKSLNTSLSGKRSSLLPAHKKQSSSFKHEPQGLLMLTGSNNGLGSFTANSCYEDTTTDFNSSEKSSSLSDSSSEQNHDERNSSAKDSKNRGSEDNVELSDEDARSVYYSPAPDLRSSDNNNNFAVSKDPVEFTGFDKIERVDSLSTIDPGFAPSELGDDSYQRNFNILNRMTSCARWQKRQPSTRPKRSGSQLAKSLFGRAAVCCYVPRTVED